MRGNGGVGKGYLADFVLVAVPVPDCMTGVMQREAAHAEAGLPQPRPFRLLQVIRAWTLPVSASPRTLWMFQFVNDGMVFPVVAPFARNAE
jgi:hypothetical protein